MTSPDATTAPLPVPDRELVTFAARDNADWCDLFARTHGAVGHTDPEAWTSPVRTPPGYPDAVTLRPGLDAAALLSRVDTVAPGCSVKDSFLDLDLSRHGFRELFRAEWIAHPGTATSAAARRTADPGARDDVAPWSRVTGPEELRAWEVAWGHRSPEPFFRPELLDAPGATVLAVRDGAEVLAGAILTVGTAAVGVSNVFAAHGVGDVWAGVLAWAAAHHPGLPLVGYEAGDDLRAPLEAGFRVVGPLRIWMADDAAAGE